MIHHALPNIAPRPPLGSVPAHAPVPVTITSGMVVTDIVNAFRQRGYAAGMAVARRYGMAWESGARAYVESRKWSEPLLAQRVAELRALRATTVNVGPDVRLEFLEVRLKQVREAIAKGHTPDPAVADKPDLPDDGSFPRWASWLAIGIAATGLLISVSKS